MTIAELKSKWNKEKSSYAKKEVGDGSQKFVKDILKSPAVFGLKEGLNSTPLEKRKYEFKEEEVKKAARRADVVIFIDSEIVIPLEVERYKNIKAGEKQIMQYQLDWEKKYGILTDGYIWRFYNNNEYREFTLKEIFEKTELFLEFWSEYIKPEFYYLSFFEKKGQRSLLREVETLNVEDSRQIFFEDITKLIRGFKNKLQLEGYLKDLDIKDREKMAVEISCAYIIQFILYKTLVDNDFGVFKKEFEEVRKGIFECLKAGQFGKILGITDGISSKISKNIYRPFAKEQEFINNKLLELYHKPKNELHEVSPWLDIFVFIKKYNFANVRNEIFGFIYENYLKELYEDTKKGQYFTDPAVVNFMLEQVGYNKENIKKRLKNKPDENHISIIDPSCGSGTFLYSAVDQLIKSVPNGSEESSRKIEELIDDNVFGLDIAEFPLYLAEMNILMRMLPLIINEKYNNPIDKKIKVFKTNDSVAEFILDKSFRNTVNDMDVIGNQKEELALLFEDLNVGYKSFMRDEGDLAEMKKSMRPPRRRFDFVIGNPPYVSYNECSKQGLLVFKKIKEKEVKLNDIYGMNLHSIPDHRKKYSPKPNLYAFFIALGLALLKDGGRLCYIIPQTILTAGDLDVLRYHLAKFTTIEKIITFSGKMFVGRGLKQNKPIATSSLIFVIRRGRPEPTHQTEIIHYKNPDDNVEKCLKNISNSKGINKKKVLQSKFLNNVANWNFIKQDKDFLNFYEEYKKNSDDIGIYYDHSTAKHYIGNEFYFDIGYNINEKILLNKPKEKENNYQYPKINKNYYSIKNIKGYWPNIRTSNSKFEIGLLENNQKYNLLDSSYKIIWSYINFNKFHFTSLPVIWARNQICGIGSENKDELLYLFSVLNSSIINKVLGSNLKNENEKDYLVSIASVKQFVRVPEITEDNQFIKNEIIKRTEEMLKLEEIKLSDLVDFSKVIMQKFDNVSVDGEKLVLEKDDREIKLKIKSDAKTVKQAIEEKFETAGRLKLKEKFKINLSELKSLPIIDFERQRLLKNYIDDLVFALYFGVRISSVGFDKAKSIKSACGKNEFYEIIIK